MLLTSIAALTPTREYYPSHLQVMQSVTWNSRLSMFTQHDDFFPLAERILPLATDTQISTPKHISSHRYVKCIVKSYS